MRTNKQVTFLTLESFRATGGIQNVCKNLSYTLNNIASQSGTLSLLNLSLYDKYAHDSYIKPRRFKGYAGDRLGFLKHAVKHGRKSQTIIIGHINLLVVALAIKLININAEIIMLAHGTEVWRKIPLWKLVFIRSAVTIWSVSDHTKNILVATHHISPEAITTLHNCLDPLFTAVKEFEKPKDLLQRHHLTSANSILLSVCRISLHDREKGYDRTLEMIPKLIVEFPFIHYLMVGYATPQEKIRLELIIEKLEIKPHVTLVGLVSEADLSKYYQLCDVFILPSQKEGFGLVFIEAASHGCTVISGNQDGSREALLHGRLGYSVDTSNPENLETQTANCLQSERSHNSRLQIQNLCLAEFSQEQYETNVLELLGC